MQILLFTLNKAFLVLTVFMGMVTHICNYNTPGQVNLSHPYIVNHLIILSYKMF